MELLGGDNGDKCNACGEREPDEGSEVCAACAWQTAAEASREECEELKAKIAQLEEENQRIRKNVEIVAGGCSDALRESGEKRKALEDLLVEVDEHFQAELSSAGPWSQYGPPKDLAERVHRIAVMKKEKGQ